MISTESLMDDNRGQEARDRLYEWEEAKKNSDLYAIWACSDSRLVLPYRNSVHIYSITAGGPRSPFFAVLGDSRIKANLIVNHHDGDEAIPGQSPGGCGGRKAKLSQVNGGTDHSGIGKFISEHVWTSDLMGQSFVAGAFTAYRSGKPTLAVTQDHLDLTMYPLLVFQDSGKNAVAEVPLHFLMAEQYFPDMIYERGIPVLVAEKIPTVFTDGLEQNAEQSIELNRKYRELRQMQKDQNSRLLVMSADIRPLAVRYPETTEIPGAVFRISIPQQTIDGAVRIEEEHLVTAFQQADYPIGHFTNLDTILIETRSLEKSASVGKVLAEQELIKNWLQDRNHHILVAQVRRGETLFIEKLV